VKDDRREEADLRPPADLLPGAVGTETSAQREEIPVPPSPVPPPEEIPVPPPEEIPAPLEIPKPPSAPPPPEDKDTQDTVVDVPLPPPLPKNPPAPTAPKDLLEQASQAAFFPPDDLCEQDKAWLIAFLQEELVRREREIDLLQRQLIEEAAALQPPLSPAASIASVSKLSDVANAEDYRVIASRFVSECIPIPVLEPDQRSLASLATSPMISVS
jgi:hypothetical protein